MNLSGRSTLVVGLGASGVAAAELCLRKGARVVLSDSAPRAKLSESALALEGKGARLLAGSQDQVPWESFEVIVVSPGVPPLSGFERARKRGALVIGELELASRFIRVPIVAIGGTNGKSTTTSLVAAILEADGRRVFAGGNLGVPLAAAADGGHDVAVVEVSSFQMELAPTFHPRVATLLNVTEDHLDRYPNFDAYAAAKGNMFVQQTVDDVAVVPKGDSIALREARRGEGRILAFGPGGDISVEGDAVVDKLRQVRYALAPLKLAGAHNLLNVCASVACASEVGASPAAVEKALATFQGLAHRTALVCELAGVRYYDDSKGTNVGATVAALRGLSEPRVVLIAGGRDKQGSYGPLVAELQTRGRGLVVIGEAAERIARAAQGVVPIRKASSMQQAVQSAAALAHAGDAVLLSPACSSFDMFRDYKHRGEVFVSSVLELRGRGPVDRTEATP